MDIPITKTFICSALFVSFLLTGCSINKKSDADEIVIKIGTFTVGRQQYENQLKKLTAIQDGWAQEDAALFLLDNYISAGLLIETAKKLDYEQSDDFIKSDSIYKEQLVVKYGKYRRANANKPHHADERIMKKILQNDIKIDYIRIPKKQEELSKSMLLYFLDGSSISRIMGDPEFGVWDAQGLSFYKEIPLKQAIVTDKVMEEIIMMQDGEVKIIKEKSACYVVRLLPFMKNPITKEIVDNEPVLLNMLMARSLENGDIIFDPYGFEKSVKYDETLLSGIDFSIAPFYTDGDFVAKIDDRLISENEVKEKISVLPVKIQCLFVNRSTRARAIATWALSDYYHEEKPGKTGAWLQPYKIKGCNRLKLNFEKIEKMEITQKNTVDDQILACSGNWSMTVKDFKRELDKLTPVTRLDIANKNLLREMIEYLAKKNHASDSGLIVNSDILESIDIMGKSYDQLNPVYDENTIVGTLENVDLSIKELRELVVRIDEFEKNRFLNLSTRKGSFIEMITKKFWLNLYDRKIIEDNPDLKKEISNYQNRILVELLYEDKLQIKTPQTNGEQSSLKMPETAKPVSEDNLFSYIRTVMQDYPIRVNSNFFQKNLNLNTDQSEYNKVIIKNIN
ncbi:MAG: hypothetical protein LBG96_05045 [Tannerella sp.]|jgi:hypothetical protein|nr:hypothetical protein [Tannerella sp.]